MSLETHKFKKTKTVNTFVISLSFLIFSIILTLGIYFYDISIINKNIQSSKEISQKESSIAELEKDSKMIIYLLYKSNKSSIEKLENYSNITFFINHILNISKTYGIDFKGFNYSKGELRVSATSSSNSINKINYKKVSKFIGEYRKDKNKDALFNLNLVKSISSKNKGIDNVFNINLTLKNNINNIFSNLEKSELENKEKLKAESEKRKEEFQRKKEFLLKKNNE